MKEKSLATLERSRKRKKERDFRMREERRARGLCTNCGELPPVEGGAMCEPCRQYFRLYAKNLRDENRVGG